VIRLLTLASYLDIDLKYYDLVSAHLASNRWHIRTASHTK